MEHYKKVDFSSSTEKTSSRRWCQLAIILCIAVVIAALCSHLMVRYLKIKTSSGGYKNFGTTDQPAKIRLYGSSVAYSGVDWRKVSEALGGPIECWASLGSTPSEWEHSPPPSKEINRFFIVVSPVDLNEQSLSDFRADYVPMIQTIQDLWLIEADRSFSKRVLSQYPTKALRIFFPTVGRSDGVMTGVRDKFKSLSKKAKSGESGEAFRFKIEGDSGLEERVSNWDPGRIKRRLALVPAKHSFNGLKMMAINRLIQKIHTQGEVTLVVLPLSPFYQKEFLNTAVRRDFDMELAAFQRSWPKVKLIRLDHFQLLQDNALFADFVHANRYGQKIATAAFLNRLNDSRRQP